MTSSCSWEGGTKLEIEGDRRLKIWLGAVLPSQYPTLLSPVISVLCVCHLVTSYISFCCTGLLSWFKYNYIVQVKIHGISVLWCWVLSGNYREMRKFLVWYPESLSPSRELPKTNTLVLRCWKSTEAIVRSSGKTSEFRCLRIRGKAILPYSIFPIPPIHLSYP